MKKKYYIWVDKSGRGEKPVKISKSRIMEIWNLSETDYFDVPLQDYLENSSVDDVWETSVQLLKCVEIV